MEWVNITAKTLPEAIDLALDNLGVDEAEAEIEVLEEPRQGLFGRLRGNARVRARVKPKATRPKVERGRNRKRSKESGRDRNSGGKRDRGRKKSGSGNGDGRGEGGGRSRKEGGDRPAAGDDTEKAATAQGSSGGDDRNQSRGDDNRGRSKGGRGQGGRTSQKRGGNDPVEEASMDEVSAQLETFLTGLTEAFGFEGAVSVDEDDGGLLASVEGRHGLMVGPKGRTLDAIQELARVTAQRSTPSNIRIKVDVGGYRALRREALVKFALEAADEARSDGNERSLEPMNSADRKVVHDALSDLADIETRSAGTDPRRRVVVVPLTIDDSDEESADAAVADDAQAENTEADETSADDTAESDTAESDTAESDTAESDTAESDIADAASDDGDASEGPSEVDDSESVGSQ